MNGVSATNVQILRLAGSLWVEIAVEMVRTTTVVAHMRLQTCALAELTIGTLDTLQTSLNHHGVKYSRSQTCANRLQVQNQALGSHTIQHLLPRHNQKPHRLIRRGQPSLHRVTERKTDLVLVSMVAMGRILIVVPLMTRILLRASLGSQSKGQGTTRSSRPVSPRRERPQASARDEEQRELRSRPTIARASTILSRSCRSPPGPATERSSKQSDGTSDRATSAIRLNGSPDSKL